MVVKNDDLIMIGKFQLVFISCKCFFYFFLIFRILNILTHMGRGENILKKLTVIYIQKGLTLEYTAQTLNFFNLHSFSNVGLTHYFFF